MICISLVVRETLYLNPVEHFFTSILHVGVFNFSLNRQKYVRYDIDYDFGPKYMFVNIVFFIFLSGYGAE